VVLEREKVKLKFSADITEVEEKIKRMREKLSDAQMSAFMNISGLKTRTILVNGTPKRTGNTQDAWQPPASPKTGMVEIVNVSKVAVFLERGTPKKNPGGKIFPKHGDFLYFENQNGQLIRKRSVRGIMPRKFIENSMPKISEQFVADVNELAGRIASA
jgi:hypothetical protein